MSDFPVIAGGADDAGPGRGDAARAAAPLGGQPAPNHGGTAGRVEASVGRGSGDAVGKAAARASRRDGDRREPAAARRARAGLEDDPGVVRRSRSRAGSLVGAARQQRLGRVGRAGAWPSCWRSSPAGGVDLALTGFAESRPRPDPRRHSQPPNDPDDAPPLPTGEPESRRGEIYELGPHRLLCGDATDPDAIAAADRRTTADGAVDGSAVRRRLRRQDRRPR